MFRQCSSDCPEKAVRQCLCSGQFFCLSHCGEHIAQRGNHNLIEIFAQLSPEETMQLTYELSSRFHTINQCKSAIFEKASYLITKIEELSTKAIEKLRKLELQYSKLMASSEYSASQIEEVNNILKSELQSRTNSHSILERTLKNISHRTFVLRV
jgi:hypothetical protein